MPLPRGEVLDVNNSELRGGGEEEAEELVGDGYRQHAATVGEAETDEEGEGIARVDLQRVLLVVRGGGEDALPSEVCRGECGPRGHCSWAGVFIYRLYTPSCLFNKKRIFRYVCVCGGLVSLHTVFIQRVVY